jgi:hypothetical protein
VENGVFCDGSQTLSYSGTSFTVSNVADTCVASFPAFPATLIGTALAGVATTVGSNLPILASTIKSIPTGWSWFLGPTAGGDSYDAVVELWFAPTSTPVSPPSTSTILRIWLGAATGVNPPGSVVVNTVTFPSITTPSGITWTIWWDGGTNITYVAAGGVNTIVADVNLFIQDAVSRSYMTNSEYLETVAAGFEFTSAHSQVGTFISENFSAVVN